MGSKNKQQQQHQGEQEIDLTMWFEEIAENAELAQKETLRCILELNYGTEYVRKWMGKEEKPRIQEMDPVELESLYRSLVPLSSHADIEPYIQRIANGDTSPILTQQPITTLSLSSGTTEGRPKYVPFTRFSSQSTLQIFLLAAAYRSRVLPVRSGGRILEFIYSSKLFQTGGGLTVGTATTHYFGSEEFQMKQRSTNLFTCSPGEVISGGEYKQSTYCHLLLGLHFCDQVEVVTSTFAYSIIHALRALEELWRELVEDIRNGSVSSTRVTSPKMRMAVVEVLLSSSSTDTTTATAAKDCATDSWWSLAQRTEERCRVLEGSGWQRAIPTLWPNAKYVYSIMTGSMLPYLDKLRHYAGQHLPLVAADYGSTESWIGVNIDPNCPPENVNFAVIPTFSYFEFIPLYHRQTTTILNRPPITERNENAIIECDDFLEADPVPLSKVKLGQQYELVVTTFTGLYRYRLGDIVEVGGFYRSTPSLKFICRRKMILSINIDKNTERDLQLVVESACGLLKRQRTEAGGGGVELVDFTSHANIVTDCPVMGHYVIYWEIRGNAGDEVLAECCREMDLGFMDHGYVVSRKAGTIGPLELRVVEEGTFRKILDYHIANGATLSQFKTPRCTRNQVFLRILDCFTLQRFFSTAYV